MTLSLKRERSSSDRAVGAAVLVIVTAMTIAVAGDATLSERLILLRYWNLFVAGIMAFLIPHVLYPDPNVTAMQALNLTPRQILSYQLRSQMSVLTTLGLSCLLIAFWDPAGWMRELPAKGRVFADGALYLTGIFSFAYYRYARIGMASQTWQEGLDGNTLRTLQKETGAVQISMGSVPTMQTTILITLVGMLPVVGGAWLSADWLPGLLLLALGLGAVLRHAHSFDRFFYQTNAFYFDFLTRPGKQGDLRTVLYPAIYWVPARWRPAAWAGIVQLDRVLPMGRLVFIGHVILWMIYYMNVTATVRWSYLLAFILAQTLSIRMLTTPRIGPLPWNFRQQPPVDWMATRFFIQLRWALPLVLSLLVVALFSPALTWVAALGWCLIYLILALLFSVLLTYSHESRLTDRYA